MQAKTRVRVCMVSEDCFDVKPGYEGYIDGYINDASGEPYAVVVIGEKIHFIETDFLTVLTHNYGI